MPNRSVDAISGRSGAEAAAGREGGSPEGLRHTKQKRKERTRGKKTEKKKDEEVAKGIRRCSSLSGMKQPSRTPSGTLLRASFNRFTRFCINLSQWRERPLSPRGVKKVRNLIQYLIKPKSAKRAAEVQRKQLSGRVSKVYISAGMGLLTSRTKFKQKLLEQMLQVAKSLIIEEPMIVEVTGDVIVVADIHGQLEDLLRIFENFGTPKEQVYVFLGDYVDRGPFGVECFMLLVAYKLLHPFNIVLLRGNHENEEQNRKPDCGFVDECKQKYGSGLYSKFRDVFYSLPVCAIVNQRVFCCHGGIGPDLDLDEVLKLERPVDAMKDSDDPLIDLLWADPEESIKVWAKNVGRGISVYFGRKQLCEFLDFNGLEMLVRGHEPCFWGYEFIWDGRLVTIFTASKYLENAITHEPEGYGAVLYIPEDPEQSVGIRFNLAPGESEPENCPPEGGGRTGGSSVAGRAPLEDDEDFEYSSNEPPPNETTGGNQWSGHRSPQTDDFERGAGQSTSNKYTVLLPPLSARQIGPPNFQNQMPNFQNQNQRGPVRYMRPQHPPPPLFPAAGPVPMGYPMQQMPQPFLRYVHSAEQLSPGGMAILSQTQSQLMPPTIAFGQRPPPAAPYTTRGCFNMG